MGSEAQIQVQEAGTRMKAVLVGMEPEEYVVFRIQGSAQSVEPPAPEARAAVRYVEAG